MQLLARWAAGWVISAAALGFTAGMLLKIISIVREISGQAGDIHAGLERAARNTDALFRAGRINSALKRATRASRDGRE